LEKTVIAGHELDTADARRRSSKTVEGKLGKRICLVTKIWHSGTGWFAAALADGLAESGVSVVFIAPPLEPAFREPTNPNVIRIAVPREFTGNPPKYRSMASKFRRITSTLLAIGRQLLLSEKFLFSWPDHEIASIPTFLALRLLGKKVIFIVHDPVPHDFARSKHKLIKRLLLRLLYRFASVLVVLGEAGRRRLMAEFQISPRKVHVIPHGAFGFACQSQIPGERMLLAFGSIRQNKNLLMVIDAVKLARASGLDVRLLVAGGYDRSNPYCLECVTAINRDPSAFINKTGFVDEAEIPELIKCTDAFLLAYSDFDSQSGVAVMAGVNGRPVIASFAGGIGELKPLGLAGVEIQQPVTPFTIASAIQEFYRTPFDRWRAAAETGRSQLSYHLDWARIARSYLHL
jgi:glycogen synthase